MTRKLTSMLVVAFACLSSTSTWALDKEDGAYQIKEPADLVEFANIVNSGEANANALLIGDLDMTGQEWTPIGTGDHRYVGTFDGQYHMINNLQYSGSDNIGIFGVVDGGCVIKNLIAGPGNEIRGGSMVGGIIGRSDGSGWVTLENVGHEGYVYATGGNAAAMIGVVINGGPATRITNCYNMGNVSGGWESALITGWFGGHGSVEVKNFWNTGKIENGQDGSNSLWRNSTGITKENVYHIYADQEAVVINADDLPTGKLAYQVNGNQDAGVWRQNLEGDNKDAHPTFDPTHALVYANGAQMCDGSPKEGSVVTYSNTPGAVRDDHQFENGFCTVCGLFDDSFCPVENDHYVISDGYQLNWFAYLVNKLGNGAANAVLAADIDMKGLDFTPIGQDAKDYKGHFDGQGHRILNLVTNADKQNQALFGQAVGGAVIENIVIDASCTIQGTAFTAGILGHVWGDGVIVLGCGNEANIVGTAQNAAGIVGCSEREVHIANCYNIGAVTGARENAGICAWMGSNNSTIKNCYSTATINDGEALWRKGEVQGENMYQIEGLQGTAFTQEQMESGHLAYLLNGRQSQNAEWFQLIGTDMHPMPFGTAIVYANGQLDCAGNAKEGTDVVYANEENTTRDDHQFENGFCSVCGTVDPDYLTPTAGIYQLSTAADVVWFAAFVNSGMTQADAVLTRDINFKNVEFAGIGNAANRYEGTFDGQGFVVSNLFIDMLDDENVGFFRDITAGAHIMNMTLDSSCSIYGKCFVGGFVGRASGNGEAVLEQLGNEAMITSVNQNAGGIVGCNVSGDLHLVLTNCYNAGEIYSGNEGGGLSGWLGNNANTTNCYNMGPVTGDGSESFARGSNIQIDNCFDPVTNWPALPSSPIEDFTNGVIYELLDAAAPGIWFLSATEGGHPVLYNTGITTGIASIHHQPSTILHQPSTILQYFDLQGRQLKSTPLRKGIYVTGGHKVVVK